MPEIQAGLNGQCTLRRIDIPKNPGFQAKGAANRKLNIATC